MCIWSMLDYRFSRYTTYVPLTTQDVGLFSVGPSIALHAKTFAIENCLLIYKLYSTLHRYKKCTSKLQLSAAQAILAAISIRRSSEMPLTSPHHFITNRILYNTLSKWFTNNAKVFLNRSVRRSLVSCIRRFSLTFSRVLDVILLSLEVEGFRSQRILEWTLFRLYGCIVQRHTKSMAPLTQDQNDQRPTWIFYHRICKL